MCEESKEQEKELIHYSFLRGTINPEESKLWDDYEDFGEEELLKRKIAKIKIYTGTYSNKPTILGFGCEFKNLYTGENEAERKHKGSEQFLDVKEFEIPYGEYLTDFHIRFPDEGDYLTQLGFETNKKKKFFVGTEDGNDKIIETNGGENIIIGTFGHINKKLDAMGILTITKKDYFKKILFSYFMLRYKIKKDINFKKKWDEKYDELPTEFKYLWKAVNLPDTPFAQIIRYCFC